MPRVTFHRGLSAKTFFLSWSRWKDRDESSSLRSGKAQIRDGEIVCNTSGDDQTLVSITILYVTYTFVTYTYVTYTYVNYNYVNYNYVTYTYVTYILSENGLE